MKQNQFTAKIPVKSIKPLQHGSHNAYPSFTNTSNLSSENSLASTAQECLPDVCVTAYLFGPATHRQNSTEFAY